MPEPVSTVSSSAPTDEAPGLTPKDWQWAYFAQDACNLSGVAHQLSRVLDRVWAEARAADQGTDHVNRHPLVLLYVAKMADLAGLAIDSGQSMTTYCDALDTARRAIGGDS